MKKIGLLLWCIVPMVSCVTQPVLSTTTSKHKVYFVPFKVLTTTKHKVYFVPFNCAGVQNMDGALCQLKN